MINLNDRRKDPDVQIVLDYVVTVHAPEIPDVDLKTVQIGDWIEGIGTIRDYAVIGLLHQLGRLGYKLQKRNLCQLCGWEEFMVFKTPDLENPQHYQSTSDFLTAPGPSLTLSCTNSVCANNTERSK